MRSNRPSGDKIEDKKIIEMNDYLINTIQQIGRTSLRRGNLVNVYLLDKLDTSSTLLDYMHQYFSISSFGYENKYYKKTYDSSQRRNNNAFGLKLNKVLLEIMEGKHKEFEDKEKPNHYSRKWFKGVIGYEGDQFKRDTIDNFDRNKQLFEDGIFKITGRHIVVQNI